MEPQEAANNEQGGGVQAHVWHDLLNQILCGTARLSPADMRDGFLNFTTSKYKLHFFETPSGLKFIMNTDLNVGSMRDALQHIFSLIYVEYVVKNPMCELNQPITSELFKTKLDEYVKDLPQFAV